MLRHDATSAFLELSRLTATCFESTDGALDAVSAFVATHLSMRSTFVGHFLSEPSRLHIRTSTNAPDGCALMPDTLHPLEHTFCSLIHAAQPPMPLVVEDVQTHPILATHPARQAFPLIGSYIGLPIVLSDNTLYGTLCAADPAPRTFEQADIALLTILCRLVATTLERDREIERRVILEAKYVRLLERAETATRHAEEAHAHLLAILDAAPIDITVWDKDGRVIHQNRSAATTFRVSPDSPTSLAERAPLWPYRVEREDGSLMPYAEYPAALAIDGGSPPPTLLGLRYGDGTRRDCLAIARYVPETQTAIGILQDVTEVRQAAAHARAAQTELAVLKKADALKTTFIAVVSHDLRTPLTGIFGFAELLTLGAHPPHIVTAYAQKIVASATRMMVMLDEYLSIQRLEAGAEQFAFEPVDLRGLCEDALAPIVHQTHRVTLNVADGVMVRADRAKLQRVIENMLTNAIKYSPQGQDIRVEAYSEVSMVRVAVRDWGVGIPDEAQPHIFQKFYRVRSAHPLHLQPGTGLGLAISREIIERHGGQIGFDSHAVGTTFWFRLPQASPHGN